MSKEITKRLNIVLRCDIVTVPAVWNCSGNVKNKQGIKIPYIKAENCSVYGPCSKCSGGIGWCNRGLCDGRSSTCRYYIYSNNVETARINRDMGRYTDDTPPPSKYRDINIYSGVSTIWCEG